MGKGASGSSPSVQQVNNYTPGQAQIMQSLADLFTGSPGTAGTPGYYSGGTGGDGSGSTGGYWGSEGWVPSGGGTNLLGDQSQNQGTWVPGTPGTPGTPGQLGQGVTPYSGELTPPTQPLQTAEFNLINQMLQGNAPGQADISGALHNLSQPWDKTEATDEWTKAVYDPSLLSWNKDILPGIQEKFAGYNAMGGGGAQKAILDAGTNLETGLSSSLAGALTTDKANTQTNQLKAAGLDMQQLTNLLSGVSGGGADQYNIQATADTANQANWASGQPYNNPWLQLLGQSMSTSGTTNLVKPGTQSAVPGLLSSAGSLMGGYGLMSGSSGLGLSSLLGLGSGGTGAAMGLGTGGAMDAAAASFGAAADTGGFFSTIAPYLAGFAL